MQRGAVYRKGIQGYQTSLKCSHKAQAPRFFVGLFAVIWCVYQSAAATAAAVVAAIIAVVAAAAEKDNKKDDNPAAVAATKAVIAHIGTSHKVLTD